MELTRAREIAEELKSQIGPACERVMIAGSIRRQKPDPGDIELLVIPKYDCGVIDMLDRKVAELISQEVVALRLNKLGRPVYGLKNKLLVHLSSEVGVDIFSTDEECWPVALVVRTGGKETNMRIATAALQRGYRFHAYGSGFTTPDSELVCRSERDVFEFVGLPYLPPEQRV